MLPCYAISLCVNRQRGQQELANDYLPLLHGPKLWNSFPDDTRCDRSRDGEFKGGQVQILKIINFENYRKRLYLRHRLLGK